jgi:L-ascorbate metabolism protein UlaG (beta-lactamase superfamily)
MRLLLLAFTPLLLSGAAAPNQQSDVVETSAGALRITPLYHGSVMLEFAGKVIHVDPWSQADYAGIPQADLIVITHTHADHMDAAIVNKLKKAETIILGPPAVTDTLNGAVGETDAIANGETKTVLGIGIEAVPMYNIVFGSSPGKLFHHKGIGNGYVMTFGDRRVYFSGDTECTPEMKALKNIDVAFLAMNPPRTMTPADAAACTKAFLPKVVYPYHYRGQKTQDFADALKGTPGVEVRQRKLEGESQ